MQAINVSLIFYHYKVVRYGKKQSLPVSNSSDIFNYLLKPIR